MAPWPRCQFRYEDDAQCVWSGCDEDREYCGIHQEVHDARARSRKKAEAKRQAKVSVERSSQEKSAPSVTGSSTAQR